MGDKVKNKNLIVFISFLVAGITILSAFPSVVSYQAAISEIEDIANTTIIREESPLFIKLKKFIGLGNIIDFLREILMNLLLRLSKYFPELAKFIGLVIGIYGCLLAMLGGFLKSGDYCNVLQVLIAMLIYPIFFILAAYHLSNLNFPYEEQI